MQTPLDDPYRVVVAGPDCHRSNVRERRVADGASTGWVSRPHTTFRRSAGDVVPGVSHDQAAGGTIQIPGRTCLRVVAVRRGRPSRQRDAERTWRGGGSSAHRHTRTPLCAAVIGLWRARGLPTPSTNSRPGSKPKRRPGMTAAPRMPFPPFLRIASSNRKRLSRSTSTPSISHAPISAIRSACRPCPTRRISRHGVVEDQESAPVELPRRPQSGTARSRDGRDRLPAGSKPLGVVCHRRCRVRPHR